MTKNKELDQKFAELFDEKKQQLDRDDPLSLSWFCEIENKTLDDERFDAFISSLEDKEFDKEKTKH